MKQNVTVFEKTQIFFPKNLCAFLSHGICSSEDHHCQYMSGWDSFQQQKAISGEAKVTGDGFRNATRSSVEGLYVSPMET